jgi:hypothetical protein
MPVNRSSGDVGSGGKNFSEVGREARYIFGAEDVCSRFMHDVSTTGNIESMFIYRVFE